MPTSQNTSTDIAVRSSADLAQVEELYEILMGRAEAPEIVEDPEIIGREILMQLLSAESDDALVLGKATGWRDLQGVPIELIDFKWRRSEFEEGGPVYFIVRGRRLDDGEQVVLTTGSTNITAQLANMARRGTLVGGVWTCVQADKATARGFFPLWLEKVKPDTVAALRAGLGSNPLDEPDEAAAA